MAIKEYDEAIARLLHCASYGYRSGEHKGPFNKIGRFKVSVTEIARVLRGWTPKCTYMAGCGMASQLSRFKVGHCCNFHRWKIMRSVLHRGGD